MRFEDSIIAQMSLMVLTTHPEPTTEHGHPMTLAVSREEVGPGANEAFVANVSVSPNSRTLFCVRVALGFCKIHLWSSHAHESLQIKCPTEAEDESWLSDPLHFVLCLSLYFLAKGLFLQGVLQQKIHLPFAL